MIRAVIFDFGQTLVDSADAFRAAEKRAQKQLFETIGHSSWHDFLTTYRKIRTEFHQNSDFSRKSMWREVCRNCRHDGDECLLEQWELEYWKTIESETQPFPESESVLETLSTRYALSMVTNTQGQPRTETHRLAAFPQLQSFFDVVIIAGEDGIPPKPDPVPFHICLEKTGIRAHEAVYVGDDWRIDICGARNAGLYPVWLKHHRVRRNWPDVEETAPVITDLEQLFDVIPQA